MYVYIRLCMRGCMYMHVLCIHVCVGVCGYLCFCICVCVSMYVYVSVSVFVCICVYVCLCLYTHIYMYGCMCVSICVWVCMCMYLYCVYMCICMYECVCAYVCAGVCVCFKGKFDNMRFRHSNKHFLNTRSKLIFECRHEASYWRQIRLRSRDSSFVISK